MWGRIKTIAAAVAAAFTGVLYVLRLRRQRDDARDRADESEARRETENDLSDARDEAQEEAEHDSRERDEKRSDGDRPDEFGSDRL